MGNAKESTGLEWALVLLISFGLTLPGWWMQGWVLTKMWTWFILPTFGLRQPGVWMCVGLVAIVGYIIPKADVPMQKRTAGEMLGRVISTAFAAPLIVLLLGWCIHKMA